MRDQNQLPLSADQRKRRSTCIELRPMQKHALAVILIFVPVEGDFNRRKSVLGRERQVILETVRIVRASKHKAVPARVSAWVNGNSINKLSRVMVIGNEIIE